MKVTTVEYKKSLTFHQDDIFVEKRPEIAFIWRSNVWKSSLLNALFWKKNMAFTSSMPGKTRTANIFLVNKRFFFTDLPWYGYARGWKESVKTMDELITWYLLWKKAFISTVIMLVDGKIGPQPIDIDMYRFLKEHEIPLIVWVTKVDKLSGNEAFAIVKKAEAQFFWEKIIGVSSVEKKWLKELLEQIDMMIQSSN